MFICYSASLSFQKEYPKMTEVECGIVTLHSKAIYFQDDEYYILNLPVILLYCIQRSILFSIFCANNYGEKRGNLQCFGRKCGEISSEDYCN